MLIVLIQKEQALVTDDWPWPIEYQEATGYGCPDSGSCSSNYYGFYNQVTNAAWQFQQYELSPQSYDYLPGASNNILYNPNTACGSSSVYIQDVATAGLYDYTPYQPDAAALNNLLGTGDSCSSYGNRNFWVLFNEWFGSTSGASTSGTVTRIYNPITQDYMLVLDNNELTYETTKENYWMNDGMVFTGYPSYAADVVPVYELYNSSDGSHVYMLAGTEMNNAMSLYGYTDDGVAFYAKNYQDGSSRPVYRLSRQGKYFFTVNTFEVSYMVSQGYTDEGIVFYEQSNSTSAPVYRLSYNGIHFYTQSLIESDIAQMGGDVYEGIAFNAQTAPTSDAMPVYRLVRNGHYIYTENRGERDALVLDNGYQSEGAAFYAYPPGYLTTTPIYETDRTTPEDHLYTTSIIESDNSINLYGYSNDQTDAFNE